MIFATKSRLKNRAEQYDSLLLFMLKKKLQIPTDNNTSPLFLYERIRRELLTFSQVVVNSKNKNKYYNSDAHLKWSTNGQAAVQGHYPISIAIILLVLTS